MAGKKAAKRGKKQAKRGAPYGNQNAKGKRGSRKRSKGGQMVVVSDAEPGSEQDAVMQGFARRREQLQAEFDDQMQGLEAAENAYKASASNTKLLGRTPSQRETVTLKMTKANTPDMRHKATREFMEMHPDWTPAQAMAPRAD